MDDGTAGEMVASCNYWEAMSATVGKPDLEGFAAQSGSKRESGGDSRGGGGRGDGLSTAAGSTLATLGGVEWAAVHLESGNVKVDSSASAAEASYFSVWRHRRTQPDFRFSC